MLSARNGRTRRVAAAAAAVALGASVLTGTGVANAAEEPGTGELTTQSLESFTGSLSEGSSTDAGDTQTTGSLDNPVVQAGGVLLLGLAVSAALAIGAGIQGGAFNDGIPGLPLP